LGAHRAKIQNVNPPAIAELSTAGFAAATGAWAWGSFLPSSQLFGPTVRRTGDLQAMALTFDDGPNPAATPQLLDLLEIHDIRATFFLIGSRVRQFPALAARIATAGHSIGNHTDTHPILTFQSPRRIRAELEACRHAIADATGHDPRWMRPPFGARGMHVTAALHRAGFDAAIMWSAWGKDWKEKTPEGVIRHLGQAGGGDIVLLHDGDHRVAEGKRQHTIDALAVLIPQWKSAGIRFVTCDQLVPEKTIAKSSTRE
jgi:peptidoglycan/xylan/chitin deacetylase (PgdA/CDA1 family)